MNQLWYRVDRSRHGTLGEKTNPHTAGFAEAHANAILKVKEIVNVTGYWQPSTDPAQPEFNASNDRVGYNALLSQWTSQNGFPPMYFTNFIDAYYSCGGPPAYQFANPTASPLVYALVTGNVSAGGSASGGAVACITGKERPTWGQIGILFAAWGASHDGVTYYDVSANGTATIDASTGDSSFSTGTASGHFLLTMRTNVAAQLQNLFDAYSPTGFDRVGSFGPALPPLRGTGTLSTATSTAGVQ